MPTNFEVYGESGEGYTGAAPWEEIGQFLQAQGIPPTAENVAQVQEIVANGGLSSSPAPVAAPTQSIEQQMLSNVPGLAEQYDTAASLPQGMPQSAQAQTAPVNPQPTASVVPPQPVQEASPEAVPGPVPPTAPEGMSLGEKIAGAAAIGIPITAMLAPFLNQIGNIAGAARGRGLGKIAGAVAEEVPTKAVVDDVPVPNKPVEAAPEATTAPATPAPTAPKTKTPKEVKPIPINSPRALKFFGFGDDEIKAGNIPARARVNRLNEKARALGMEPRELIGQLKQGKLPKAQARKRVDPEDAPITTDSIIGPRQDKSVTSAAKEDANLSAVEAQSGKSARGRRRQVSAPKRPAPKNEFSEAVGKVAAAKEQRATEKSASAPAKVPTSKGPAYIKRNVTDKQGQAVQRAMENLNSPAGKAIINALKRRGAVTAGKSVAELTRTATNSKYVDATLAALRRASNK